MENLALSDGRAIARPYRLAAFITLAVLILAFVPTVQAQMGGEDLPPGVTMDDVYRVSRKMYCDVCQGIPISDCPSPTCAAWRQEVAVLLGEGYTDDEILEYFADRYGEKISGVPIKEKNRLLALGLPALLATIFGLVVVWQLLRLRERGESRALQAAKAAGTLVTEYGRPVPDNVDFNALERFLRMVDEQS
jgi:cytochrome c-type biogenesis protein CcmH/NrfF